MNVEYACTPNLQADLAQIGHSMTHQSLWDSHNFTNIGWKFP